METGETTMTRRVKFKPGDLVRARCREWVVLPETRDDVLKLRPLGGSEDDATVICLSLEPENDKPTSATFDLPDPHQVGSQKAGLLLRDALRLKLRAGAGPFRSFGNLYVEPRAYQLVPLLMALKLDTIRLLVADDVGIGKTIEAGLIARELLDRGEIERFTVICPPHLCEQWQKELAEKFNINAEVVRTGTAVRLERNLPPDESVFDVYPYTVVSLDYIKSDRRRVEFLRACPEFVICDEAHTCVQSNSNARHQRYQLLKGLAESNSSRGLVLLTATPHSGDDTAFHNLLGLLNPKFAELVDLPEGEIRRKLRSQLSQHLVQRRRGDIEKWKDESSFPIRESREATYRLTGEWGQLFDDVLAYARTMVQRTKGGTKFEQRMSWWAALALLRCASSSPATVESALRTRLESTENAKEDSLDEKASKLDDSAREAVMDEISDDLLVSSESTPFGTVERVEDSAALSDLINRAVRLCGPKKDPKLNTLIEEIKKLVENDFRPVVFCRYIRTAHYIGEELKNVLALSKTEVTVITGELTPDERQECLADLIDRDQKKSILVATDCLSEGINLQEHFNAVVHYDLTWNPTRHEQREGRVDRFGQASKIVRALMLYGENNPVDGAVLRVILRKAEKIRKELGVSVPLPTDNNKVVEVIMNTVLNNRSLHSRVNQEMLNFGSIETEVDDAWLRTTRKSKRTIFAQHSMSPDEVMPEWEKVVSILGGPDDVARFVRLSAERLEAPLDKRAGYYQLPVAHLPKPLQERLYAIGFKDSAKLTFHKQRAPAGTIHIHRTHPLVATLADFVTEQAIDAKLTGTDVVARSGAIISRDITVRTVLYLLRLRTHLLVERRGEDGQFTPLKSLLSEECLSIAVQGNGSAKLLVDEDALSLLALEPARNMQKNHQVHLIHQAINALQNLEKTFEQVAHERAQNLLDDHQRIREASKTKGLRYKVFPALPVDKIGIYVFMPLPKM